MTSARVYKFLRFSALGYLLFVIYGSLVPLDFHPHPMTQAWERFLDIPYLNLGIQSRADWVANILLMVPLSFLFLACARSTSSLAGKLVMSASAVFACFALAVSIEFAQIFFPPRTVSLNDIIAESLGAVVGAMMWWRVGKGLKEKLAGWLDVHAPQNRVGQFFFIYLFLLLGYSLLPLDLTLSLTEIYHKWRDGRVVLVPFSHAYGSMAEAVYGIGSDVLLWSVLGVLARLSRKDGGMRLVLGVAGFAALIEFMQLFVYTRTTDVGQIITATLGGGLGIYAATRWRGAPAANAVTQQPGAISGHAAMLLWGLFLGWSFLLILVFWYPFDFEFTGSFLRQRMETLQRVPFEAYYYGSEYRAVTEFLHKTGFFFPLGALFLLAAERTFQRTPRKLLHAVIIFFLALFAFGVELVQLFLPGKNADITDWILEILGGIAGMLAVSLWPRLDTSKAMPTPTLQSGAPIKPSLHPMLHLAAGMVLTALFGWFVLHSSKVPYNLRELTQGDYPLVSLALLSMAIYWCFAFPVWSTAWMRDKKQGGAYYPLLVLGHAAVAWVLVRIATPVESMHDIVGSPVLNWSWEWELWGRFIALFGAFSLLAHGAALLVAGWCRQAGWQQFGYWLLTALLLAPLMHLVVVNYAATDNLTELMAHGGGIVASLALASYVLTLSLAASLLAAQAAKPCRRLRRASLVWLLLSLPLCYWLLTLGTEQTLIKYNKVFSAMQFMFSSDREHYATGLALVVRYGIFQLAATLLLAVTQYPLWAGLFNSMPASVLRRKRRHARFDESRDGVPADGAGQARATMRKSAKPAR